MSYIRAMILVGLTAALSACNSGDQGLTSALAPDVDTARRETAATSQVGVTGSVTGSAMLQVFPSTGLGLRKLTFNAHSFADGTVVGEWNLVVGASILHGDVDCLNILPDGKTARLAGIVTDAKFTSFLPGTAFALEVIDNGEGNSAPPDQTTNLQAFRNAPPEVGRLFCETGEAPPGLEHMEVLLGNVQVHAD